MFGELCIHLGTLFQFCCSRILTWTLFSVRNPEQDEVILFGDADCMARTIVTLVNLGICYFK